MYDIYKNLDNLELIGEGEYGRVYLDNDIVVKEGEIPHKEIEIIQLLSKLDYPHGVDLISYSRERIAMNKIDGYILTEAMRFFNPDILTPQIFKALKALHYRNVVHNDLHSDNIIYNPKENKIYIIDYGLSYIATPIDLIHEAILSSIEFNNHNHYDIVDYFRYLITNGLIINNPSKANNIYDGIDYLEDILFYLDQFDLLPNVYTNILDIIYLNY